MWFLLLLAAQIDIAAAITKGLDGYKVVQFNFTTSEHLKQVRELLGDEVDYWRSPSIRFPTEVMLSPEAAQEAIRAFEAIGVKHAVLNQDVQRSLDFLEREQAHHRSRRSTATLQERVVGTFATYDDQMAWLEQMAQTYPNIVTVENIGKTFEGRTMKNIKIGDKSISGKLKVMMESGIHAREWLAHATIIYIINEFCTKYGADIEITKSLKKIEWNFVINGNPDGYEYSRNSYRMWRKTRSRYSITQTCYGCDPNRNYDYFWGGDGSSNNQCSDTYRGPRAFSEVETQNLRDLVLRLKPKLYAAVHTYVPVVLYPYGYDDYNIILPENGQAHKDLGKRIASAIRGVNGLNINAGNTVDVLGAAAGGSDDWAVGVKASEFAFTFELRPGCQGGFLGCVSDIVPSGREVLAGFLEMSRAL